MIITLDLTNLVNITTLAKNRIMDFIKENWNESYPIDYILDNFPYEQNKIALQNEEEISMFFLKYFDKVDYFLRTTNFESSPLINQQEILDGVFHFEILNILMDYEDFIGSDAIVSMPDFSEWLEENYSHIYEDATRIDFKHYIPFNKTNLTWEDIVSKVEKDIIDVLFSEIDIATPYNKAFSIIENMNWTSNSYTLNDDKLDYYIAITTKRELITQEYKKLLNNPDIEATIGNAIYQAAFKDALSNLREISETFESGRIFLKDFPVIAEKFNYEIPEYLEEMIEKDDLEELYKQLEAMCEK